MPHVTDSMAREAATKPRTFRGYEVAWGDVVVIYDDPEAAEALARQLKTEAKHSEAKHDNSAWTTFSIVHLPEAWEQMA